MKTNKNIDRLFQEKLKDFEVSPPASVWEGIESNLQQKNPRSILPLWLKISGAAAILLLLTLGGISYFDNTPNEIIITDTKDVIKNTPVNKNDILNPALNSSDENNSVITDSTQNNDEVSETLKGDIPQNEKQIKFDTTSENSQISEVNKKEREISSTINNLKSLENKNSSSESIIADVRTNKSNSSDLNSKESINEKLLKSNEKEEGGNSQIASELTNSNRSVNNSANKILNADSEKSIVNNETKTTDLIKINESNKILDNTNKIALNTDSENNILKSNDVKSGSVFNIVDENKNTIAKSNDIKFGEKTNVETNLDSIQKNILKSEEGIVFVPNKYDKLLTSEENEEEDEIDTKKWSVASTIAPIYYNTFNTEGSPLDLQFKDSPKTGSKSIAYGVKIGYKFNDKLTLQAGVSKIDVGYKIGDVFINPTQQYQVRLTNVNYANTNTAAILNVNAGNFLNDTAFETTSSTGFTGELNQSFGYIEIPLELKYSLTNTSKKLGVNLIGGVSTLLLNKNEVFVTTPEFSSNLGEANNLNKVNFSGNIGVDIDYKINKRIYINVAPMLKIHTKTFSNNDNNFEPYLFGVYTGLNYRF